MDRYRIAYVDERADERDEFERYAAEDFDIELIEPLEDIDELVEELLSLGVDAIVTDYNLFEYNKKIKYDGVDLVDKIQEIREGFPCFVLTSYDEEAAQQSDDVNRVYVKEVLNDNGGKLSFKERIRIQIKHYHNKIERAKEEHAHLSDLNDQGKLDASAEQRLIELDDFIENCLNKKAATPSTFKETQNIAKLSKLIDSTKELMKILEEKK